MLCGKSFDRRKTASGLPDNCTLLCRCGEGGRGRLNTDCPDVPVCEPTDQPFEKAGGGMGGLLRLGGQEARACELIHGSILE